MTAWVFETDAVLQACGTRDKLGLLGMQERIRLAGGTLDLESTPERGTTVFVRVPVETKMTTEPGASASGTARLENRVSMENK